MSIEDHLFKDSCNVQLAYFTYCHVQSVLHLSHHLALTLYCTALQLTTGIITVEHVCLHDITLLLRNVIVVCGRH